VETPEQSPPTLPHNASMARNVVLVTYTLLLLELAWSNYLSAIPLLLFIIGIVKQSWRSHIWLCFLLLWYFLGNIDNLFRQEDVILNSIELVLIVTLFIASMLYCRWSKVVEQVQHHSEHTEEL
jgi:uncharacterized membrane protein